MASEVLARAGTRGGPVVLEAMVGRGEKHDGVSVSTVLTSTPHRRRTPKENRSIPTTLAGRPDAGPVDVSAVDTGLPAGSTPRGLGGEAGRSHPGAGFTFPT